MRWCVRAAAARRATRWHASDYPTPLFTEPGRLLTESPRLNFSRTDGPARAVQDKPTATLRCCGTMGRHHWPERRALGCTPRRCIIRVPCLSPGRVLYRPEIEEAMPYASICCRPPAPTAELYRRLAGHYSADGCAHVRGHLLRDRVRQ